MSAAAPVRLTPQAYFALERRAERKSEYLNGCVYAMSSASREHNLITHNLSGQLYLQLNELASSEEAS